MNAQWQALMDQLSEQVRGAARFRRWALAVTWLVCLAGWIFIAMKPDVYAAEARVYVDTRTSLAPALQGLTISQDVQARLSLVSESLLGQAQLEQLAHQLGIDQGVVTPVDKSIVLDYVRDSVKLDASNSGSGTIYKIGYSSWDRDISLKAVQILLKNFVDGTQIGGRADTKTMQTFLKEQIGIYEERLRKAEQQMADFKRRNVGQMPGAEGGYFARLQGAMADVDRLRSALNVAITKREELQRQLASSRDEIATATPAAIDDSPTAVAIRETDARMQELLLKYTDIHPDVVSARETLQQLRSRYAQELAVARKNPATVGASTNPVTQNIQRSLTDVQVEIAGLRSELATRESAVGQLRSMVNVVPGVEAEQSRLNRDYDDTRGRYNEFVQRLDKANLGESAESAESTKFEIIGPPVAGFKPTEPNRPLLMAFVLLVGLGAGGGVAYLLNLLKPTFHSSQALQETSGYPVLGMVSMAWLDRYQRHQLASYGYFSLGILGLMTVFVVILNWQSLLPLVQEKL